LGLVLELMYHHGGKPHWGQLNNLTVPGHGSIYSRFSEWRGGGWSKASNCTKRTFENDLSSRWQLTSPTIVSPIMIPSVIGRTESDAMKVLMDVGLVPVSAFIRLPSLGSIVKAQRPLSNVPVPPGSSVILNYGPDYTPKWANYLGLGTEHFLNGPSAVSWGANRIDVFVRGTDNRLYTKSFDGSSWNNYSKMGEEEISSAPAACSWGANRIDVFVRGTDNRLYTKSFDGSSWNNYSKMGEEEISSAPAACSWGANRIDVFVRGTENRLYTKSFDGSSWNNYSKMGEEEIR